MDSATTQYHGVTSRAFSGDHDGVIRRDNSPPPANRRVFPFSPTTAAENPPRVLTIDCKSMMMNMSDDRPSDERAMMDRLHKLNFCRFCLHHPEMDGKEKFLNILNTKVNRVGLRKIILDLVTINVKEHDLLPKIICQCCYRFFVKWFETERNLRRAEELKKKKLKMLPPKYLSNCEKFSAKKKKRSTILQQQLCKIMIKYQLIMLNIVEKINEFKKQEETQNPPNSVTARHDIEPTNPNEPGFCICGQEEYGRMIACDNKECPYEWFHYECVDIVDTPKGIWHCNHCIVASVK